MWLDWQDEITLLAPYLSGEGGVIAVTGQQGSACQQFLRLVKGELRRNGRQTLIVTLDPENESTRDQFGILVTMERKLGISPAPSDQINIVRDVEAGGDVEVRDITVVEASGPLRLAEDVRTRAEALVERARTVVRDSRLAVVLVNWHQMPARTFRWFFADLWDNGLAELISRNLLLICADESIAGTSCLEPHGMAPSVHVRLPSEFLGKSRDHALQDAANLIQSYFGEKEETARVRAQTLLATSRYSPACSISNLIALSLNLTVAE